MKLQEVKDISIQRIKLLGETAIMVNLDAPPKLPFGNADIESQAGNGWVKIEFTCPLIRLRADGNFIFVNRTTHF